MHEPAPLNGMAALSRRVDQKRCEPTYPPIKRDVIDLNAGLGDEFFPVQVRQPKPQIQRTANRITFGGNRNPTTTDSTSASWTHCGWSGRFPRCARRMLSRGRLLEW